MIDFDAFKAKYQHAPVKEYPNRVCEVMPEPVVSVHVSTYQHADFIRDCLDGVLMQETDFPFEIIIGEDESDDGTREICKGYADQYAEQIRLFLHRRENNIAIHGRPTGRFQFTYSHFVARGKYIAVCEGDDYWTDPLKLQKQVDFLEANPGYVLSHHDASIVDADGKQLSPSKLPDENKCDFSHERLMRGPFLLTLSLCFRNTVKSYPEEFFEVLNSDTFLISLLGQYGKGAYEKEIELAVYRVHNGSMWSSRTAETQLEIQSNTFKHLHSFYKKRYANTVSYYKKRYINANESIYYTRVKKNNYQGAFHIWVYIVQHYLKQGDYRQAVVFSLRGIRFLLGYIRKEIFKL